MNGRRRAGLTLLFVLALAPGACAGGGGEVGEEPPAAEAKQAVAASASEAASPGGTTAAPVRRETAPLRRLEARVVASYPHDDDSYTQGLLFADGALLESAGRYGVSELRRVDLASGEVIRRVRLPDDVFAEGLALLPAAGGQPRRLVQLSWREGLALVWDAVTFEPLGEFRYQGEGWGLCYDASGDRLVMSDGSSWLTFRDPLSFAETGGVEAQLAGRPLRSLNELECVDGVVWANLYGSDSIAGIDLADGQVTALVDASGLLSAGESRGVDVLNGIALDPADGSFLITGKLWPKLFRVRFEAVAVPPAAPPAAASGAAHPGG